MRTLWRRFHRLLCLLLALPFSVGSATLAGQTTPPTTSAFLITGTVVSTTTGSPVPHCHLIVAKIELGSNTNRRIQQEDGVDTDERGHFVIHLPSPGRWSLRASAKGYRSQFYDQHENFSSSIVLTEQAPTMDLLFHIAPDSTIIGVILDEASEPIRQAQISVYSVPKASMDGAQAGAGRAFAVTDDRGHYEVAGLAPGDYRILVSARPWYAQSAQSFRNQRPDTPQLEPSLDVVYPNTWFPGVTNIDAAETVTLHDGETRQADMQLNPIPSVHLRIPLPLDDPSAPPGNRNPIRYPQVSNVTGNSFIGLSMSANGQGQLDVGGLAPGTYRVQMAEENGRPGRSTIVEVTANSAHTLDLSAADVTATVHLKIDGGPGTESLPVSFVDIANDRNIFRSMPVGDNVGGNHRLTFQSGQSRSGQQRQRSDQPKPRPSQDRMARVVDLPPGRYRIFQGGSANFFIAGMTQGSKEISGRSVIIPSGESSLTVHIATGRGTVTGIASKDGKPVIGALVLLVPITVNEPGSIPEVRRDQTNTDGSYDLLSVIPGQYILIAIDKGWNINWSDPATLNHYLIRGIPLDLRIPSTFKQNLEAQ